MKLRIYLDTSVISALHDYREPARQRDTAVFWEHQGEYDVSASYLTRQELEQVTDADLRIKLIDSLQLVTLFPLTDEMNDLASRFIAAGVFTYAMFNDALHVAAAVLTRQDILVSWNFKHLVNRRRRAQVNQVNTLHGLPAIDIVAPPEM